MTTQQPLITRRKLFIDIETVPLCDPTDEATMPALTKRIWEAKYKTNNPEPGRMALFPEFSKVFCISVWYFKEVTPEADESPASPKPAVEYKKIVDNIYATDEKTMLTKFATVIGSGKFGIIIWHNAKQFDIPFLIKRYIANNMKVPKELHFLWKKPRELTDMIHDTMDLRKGISWSSAGLDTICMALNIPSPKMWGMTGQDVWVWYRSTQNAEWLFEHYVKETTTYCNADVSATMDVYKAIMEAYDLFTIDA